MLIGIIGVVILLFAWVIELWVSIKKHKTFIDLRFAATYLVATISLIIHAYQIGDMIFFWLQAGLIVLVIFEVLYTLKLKKK